MGQIGRFIDQACAAHPTLMRKVLDRPFGDLRDWIDFDEEGDACGCLIGTMALCNGYDEEAQKEFLGSPELYAARAIWPDAKEWGPEEDEAARVGQGVFVVSVRLTGCRRWWTIGCLPNASPEANALTAELIKRRIARRLGVTYARPQVEVQHA